MIFIIHLIIGAYGLFFLALLWALSGEEENVQGMGQRAVHNRPACTRRQLYDEYQAKRLGRKWKAAERNWKAVEVPIVIGVVIIGWVVVILVFQNFFVSIRDIVTPVGMTLLMMAGMEFLHKRKRRG